MSYPTHAVDPRLIRDGLARAQDGLMVYRGACLLGFIVTRRDGFDAIHANSSALGRFTTERAAAVELLEAERRP